MRRGHDAGATLRLSLATETDADDDHDEMMM